MANSSKTVTQTSEVSSKLELPTTQQRGSSVLNRKSQAATSEPAAIANFSEQPTAISQRPPLADPNSTALATSAEIAKTLIGCDLLHFHVEEFVGGGGMGAVFRGTDTALGRTVAIKVLFLDHTDEDTVRRFLQEAKSAAKLDHPAIPHVYFVGEQDGWHFIVFEFIEGENIRDYVAHQGPLSIPQTIVFLADIVDALQHASSRDVVHRDIKPSNVLITHDGHAKLVDMGLARSQQVQSTTNDLTATGVTLGTFDYISPEQGRDPRSADIRSDIYSLGCTLYFMLMGRPPFPEGTMLQKLLSHTSDSPPDPSQLRGDVPPRLTEILARMLAKNPDHRYQSADELFGEILFLAEEQNVTLNAHRESTIVVEQRVTRETGWGRHLPWLLPTLALIATAIALQAWQVKPSPPPQLPESGIVVETPEPAAADTSAPIVPFANAQDGAALDADEIRPGFSDESGTFSAADGGDLFP